MALPKKKWHSQNKKVALGFQVYLWGSNFWPHFLISDPCAYFIPLLQNLYIWVQNLYTWYEIVTPGYQKLGIWFIHLVPDIYIHLVLLYTSGTVPKLVSWAVIGYWGTVQTQMTRSKPTGELLSLIYLRCQPVPATNSWKNAGILSASLNFRISYKLTPNLTLTITLTLTPTLTLIVLLRVLVYTSIPLYLD